MIQSIKSLGDASKHIVMSQIDYISVYTIIYTCIRNWELNQTDQKEIQEHLETHCDVTN